MKETKIYQDPEHKNHRQLLKNVHYNAPFIQQGFINQWVFQETHCVKHCYVTSGNIRKHCRRKVELNGLLYVIERLPIGIEDVDLLTLL
jgi:hypothetical protein